MSEPSSVTSTTFLFFFCLFCFSGISAIREVISTKNFRTKKQKTKNAAFQARRCVCAHVAYLCAQQSATDVIDVLEDEVALETQKYKMPCILAQMEKQNARFIFIYSVLACRLAPRSAIAVIFVPQSLILHFTLRLLCHICLPFICLTPRIPR